MALVNSNNNNPNQPKGGPGRIGKILPTIPIIQKPKPIIINKISILISCKNRNLFKLLLFCKDK